jgi:L-threonylcarbamoyladenylate synthase
MHVDRAAEVLLGGGVIAYPTEGVFGLGCMPDDDEAIARILEIKQRGAEKGLILVAAAPQQLDHLVVDTRLPEPDPAKPVTWIVQPTKQVSPLVKGDNPGLAVRITTNPVAAALCRAVASPIVSTSANLSGRPTARNRYVLQRQFGALVDYVCPGECGPASGGPSEIRELRSGAILRPGKQ